MSILAKLMGKKLLGTVEIKFYGSHEASVDYKTDCIDELQVAADLVELFALYYAKTLCDLGRGKPAEALIAEIHAAIETVLRKIESEPVSILGSGTSLTEPRLTGSTRIHTGVLYGHSEQRFINTHWTYVEQDYYAPVSAIVFLEVPHKPTSKRVIKVLDGFARWNEQVLSGIRRLFKLAEHQ